MRKRVVVGHCDAVELSVVIDPLWKDARVSLWNNEQQGGILRG
jgi:hypothetical protein